MAVTEQAVNVKPSAARRDARDVHERWRSGARSKERAHHLEYCTRIISLFARANMERDTSEMSTNAIVERPS